MVQYGAVEGAATGVRKERKEGDERDLKIKIKIITHLVAW